MIIIFTQLFSTNRISQRSTWNYGRMGSGHDAYVPCEYLSRASCVRIRRFAGQLTDVGTYFM